MPPPPGWTGPMAIKIALRLLVYDFFLPEPVDEQIAHQAHILRKLETRGPQVFRGALVGGGKIAHRQRVLGVGIDFPVADNYRRQVASFESSNQHLVIER